MALSSWRRLGIGRAILQLSPLQRLEAESIHILRELVAECVNPVMLYSIGKDYPSVAVASKAALPSGPWA